jgi:hypothetical protein
MTWGGFMDAVLDVVLARLDRLRAENCPSRVLLRPISVQRLLL